MNWKTTIGGAFSALGTALMGVGIIPQLSGTSSRTLTLIAMVGFVCNAIGSFLGHLFAADAVKLSDLTKVVAVNTAVLQNGLSGPGPTAVASTKPTGP